MRARAFSILASLLFSSTGLSYTANDGAKTITSDGSASDTMAASLYVLGKDEDDWQIVIGTAGGSYAWTQAEMNEVYFNMPRNCTVRGASSTNRPTILLNSQFTVVYASGKVITVKDLIFTAGARQPSFFIRGNGPTAGFRFTNVKWQGDWSGQTMWVGDGTAQAATNAEGPFGLIDNCEGDGLTTFNIYSNIMTADGDLVRDWRRPMAWGTEKAVVFENNYFHKATYSPGAGLTDPFNGGSLVFRNNIVENSVVLDHGADHYGNHVRSSKKHEISGNTFRITEAGRTALWMIYFRGGTAAIFDNTFEVTGAGSSLTYGIYWDYYRANYSAGPQNSIYDRFYNPLNTTIAAGSNGQSLPQRTIHVADTTAFLANPENIVGPVYTTIAAGSNGATLPQGTVHVADASAFPEAGRFRVGTPTWVDSGFGSHIELAYTGKTATTLTGVTNIPFDFSTRLVATGDVVSGVGVGENWKWSIFIENIKVTTSAGVQTIRATGKTATSFTGCFGGTGTMSTGGAVTRASDYFGTQQPGSGTITALVAAGSNGATLPQATIHVDDTSAFPSSGSLLVNYNVLTGAGTAVTYTGKTATSFTGCAGGAGAIATGQLVGGVGQDPRWPNEPWGSMPIWQWNNRAIGAGGVGTITSRGVHDFIQLDRDLFIRDADSAKPTATGTWLDSYTPLVYPHPLNTTSAPPSGRKRARIGSKEIRIGGKVVKIGAQ